MRYRISGACASDIGKRRQNNEDNFLFQGNCLPAGPGGQKEPLTMTADSGSAICLAVFDGIGGESYGEEASYAAARMLQQCLAQPKSILVSHQQYLETLVEKLNRAVRERARELVTDRMGTTLAALYVTARHAYVVNLGDSRGYLFRAGRLEQLTVEDAASRPYGSGRKAPITQYLGMDPGEVRLVPHVRRVKLRKGDRYLLCTDGLSDMVAEDQMVSILKQSSGTRDTLNALMDLALEQGGRDNVTAIVCDIC